MDKVNFSKVHAEIVIERVSNMGKLINESSSQIWGAAETQPVRPLQGIPEEFYKADEKAWKEKFFRENKSTIDAIIAGNDDQ